MFGCFAALAAKTGAETQGAAPGPGHAARPGAGEGLLSGTRVATATGWRRVEALSPGDLVLTFDAGLQPVARVTQQAFDAAGGAALLVELPGGALGNREAMQLLPGQTVMVESDAAEDLYGDPFSLIRAEAMAALSGARRVPPPEGALRVRLHFAAEQVIFARGGLLFLCPACPEGRLHAAAAPPFRYAALPMEEARWLAARIEAEAARGPYPAPGAFPMGSPA